MQTNDKLKFFQHCQRILNQGGGLFFVDVMREDQQNRDDYIHAYISYMTDHWLALNKEEKNTLSKHIGENDFPETASWYRETSKQVGFSSAEKLGQHTLHQAWYFSN